MNEKTALVPSGVREIEFYGDQIVTVLVFEPEQEQPTIYVPIRPLCEYIGVSWSGQRERIMRDPVLSEVVEFVRVTRTKSPSGSARGNPNVLALPIEYLNGWLFGINATRVKEEIRDTLIRYQRECYGVLWDAFRLEIVERDLPEPQLNPEEIAAALYNVRIGINGILDYLLRSQEHDQGVRRLLELVRLDVHEVGGLIEEGDILTERQRQTLYQLGLEVAALLAQLEPKRNPFAVVFGTLKKTFDVPTYRQLPRPKYRKAYEFLASWKQDLQRQIRKKGEEPCIP